MTNLNGDVVAQLLKISPGGVELGVDLSKISKWRIGGEAKCIVRPGSKEELSEILQFVDGYKVPYIVIGSTTNLLFSDHGLNVLVIQISSRLSKVLIDGNIVYAESGIWVPLLARKLATNGLTGLEHIAGIPGTLGGLICMNGGSQRRGIGENILTVETVTPEGKTKLYGKVECEFLYRSSIFQNRSDIIVGATFEVEKGSSKAIKHEMLSILSSRRKKFPQKLPNCGSVFVSDPAMYKSFGPPGAVIEQCGLKGMAYGGAEISPLHANFIVNKGAARALDVLYLIKLAQSRVYQSTGYNLKAEAIYISEDGTKLGADKQAEIMFPELC